MAHRDELKALGRSTSRDTHRSFLPVGVIRGLPPVDPALAALLVPSVLTDDLLKKLHRLNEQGRTILFIEHDREVVMNHSERVIVLQDGQTLAIGPPEIVQEDDRVIDAYLGGLE